MFDELTHQVREVDGEKICFSKMDILNLNNMLQLHSDPTKQKKLEGLISVFEKLRIYLDKSDM